MKIKVNNLGGMTPNRAHYNDSGADVYAPKSITLKAHSVTTFGLGISLDIPDGYDVIMHCKSGLSSKGIWSSNAPIDAGYKGEIHAVLLNTTDEDYTLKTAEKVGQLVIRPVIYADFIDSKNWQYDERNDGSFGSTGR